MSQSDWVEHIPNPYLQNPMNCRDPLYTIQDIKEYREANNPISLNEAIAGLGYRYPKSADHAVQMLKKDRRSIKALHILLTAKDDELSFCYRQMNILRDDVMDKDRTIKALNADLESDIKVVADLKTENADLTERLEDERKVSEWWTHAYLGKQDRLEEEIDKLNDRLTEAYDKLTKAEDLINSFNKVTEDYLVG
jgi:chromosome segregation ATPase